MAARAGIVSLDPNLNLEEAKRRIEAERASQLQGMQSFGSDMDQRLQGIYGQLVGAQEQGVKTTQGIYGNAAQGVQSAYDSGGSIAGAGAAQVQSGLANLAKMMGLDPAAVREVSGRLGEQAMRFGMSQQQGMTNRVGNIQQLGAGMTGVMQMGVQTAQQAMAQGRQDIAKKVTTEIQRINTLAAQTQTGFVGIKADQARQELLNTQKELMKAQAELEREQRADARAAASEARAASRASARDPIADWLFKQQYMAENPSASDQLAMLNLRDKLNPKEGRGAILGEMGPRAAQLFNSVIGGIPGTKGRSGMPSTNLAEALSRLQASGGVMSHAGTTLKQRQGRLDTGAMEDWLRRYYAAKA